MTFGFGTNKRIISRYDGSQFQEETLVVSGTDGINVTEDASKILISGSAVLRAGDTMTGPLILNADPSANLGAATKQYVDNTIGSAAKLQVAEDGSLKYDDALKLDFGHALDVTSGVGAAQVAVDESELTNVVFLTGNQTISGEKTFVNDVNILANLIVSGTQTILHTEQLLVEDNIITLNSTITGSPLLDAGIEVERGLLNNSMILWNESLDRWEGGISGALEKIILQSDLDAAVSGLNGDLTALSGALQGEIDLKVDRAGDTMTGNLTLASGISLLAAVSGAGNVGSLSVPFSAMYANAMYDNGDDPTAAAQLANKQYVDSKVEAKSISAKEDGAGVVSGIQTLNFTHALDIADAGAGQLDISVDETELTNVVFLTGNQTISGVKTFASPVVLAAGVEPASISATGASGELRWADDYLYLCVASNSWKRVAIAQF